MIGQHFVSAHQQVGDFRAVKVGNQIQKNGGNVASHFLTPDGHVIHSVTGPVSPSVLMDEANWAINLYAHAKSLSGRARLRFVSSAHLQASWSPASKQDRRIHELLTCRPLPHLQAVYQEVFEDILGQRVSKAGPRLAQAAGRLEFAKKTGSPVLFILHDGQTWTNQSFTMPTRKLLNEYVMIVMPVRELPALSQLTNQPPFVVSSKARPMFVVTDSDFNQIGAVAGWNENGLSAVLARGLVDALERNQPNLGQLVRAQRLLRSSSPESARRVRELTIRVQQEEKAARDAAKKNVSKLRAT